MDRQWPFFGTLLSNLDMVIAKSDLAIAARYVELVEDKKLGKRIFARIEAEWQRTNEALDAHHRRDRTGWPRTRRWRARSSTASPTSTRSTTCRSS